jgi:hypothetical protein
VKKLAAVPAAAILLAALAACSSSSSGPAAAKATARATASPEAAAEVIYGKATGKAAMANPPSFQLAFTGPVTASGSISLGGGNPVKGQSRTIVTTAGDLTVTLASAGTGASTSDNSPPCPVRYVTTVPLSVNGAKSTGKFAGAAGLGQAVVVMAGDLPLLKDGTCNQGNGVNPLAATAVSTFTVTIPVLTLKDPQAGPRGVQRIG